MVSPTRFYCLAVERLARIIDQSLAAGPDDSDHLDEYVGLGPEDPQSYHYFMQQSLFQDINILPQNTHIPDGLADDLDVFCEQYEQQIRDLGGIDLQILEEVRGISTSARNGATGRTGDSPPRSVGRLGPLKRGKA